MRRNPDLRKRKSIRLHGYDYASAGAYFVTICSQNMEHIFGKIADSKMILNEYGEIAHSELIKLPERYQNMLLDVFQIMPNHIHVIIILTDNVGATLAVAPINKTVGHYPNETATTDNTNATVAPNETVGNIIGAYKSLVANQCLKICKLRNEIMGKLWQRNYYEHIIRNETEYIRIAKYIRNNPILWT